VALGKQAKVLTNQQIQLVLSFLATTRDPDRNRLIFLLSIRAGLRAKEIANLTWSMVMDADGAIADCIHLEDIASKGRSGREIPLNKQLKGELQIAHENLISTISMNQMCSFRVIQTQRSKSTSAQVIVNLFKSWYDRCGLLGCSSHSGRRTFITNAAKKISTVGGSIRDVQVLAGHSSLQTTQRYIDSDNEAKRRVVDLI
jgi:integrase